MTGFASPLALGTVVRLLLGLPSIQVMFLGLCIAITALPVSVPILMDLGTLQTELRRRIISAAVMNDVTSLLILGVILDMQSGTGTWRALLFSAFWTVIKAPLFMASGL